MVEINSPLGRRQMAAQQQKVLSVPDESEFSSVHPEHHSYPQHQTPRPEYMPPPAAPQVMQHEEYIQARKASIEEKNKINPEAKKRIEFLIGLGRAKRDVPVDGVVFTLQSLSDSQMHDVMMRLSTEAKNNADAAYISRRVSLAHALILIDGQKPEIILGSGALEDKLELFRSMDDEVVGFLYKNYEEISTKQRQKFALKDDKDAQEVVEQIKK